MSSVLEPPSGPLAGIRVLEIGSLIAGPFCGQLLGDFGAEIIKVEEPGAGDAIRGWGPVQVDGTFPWWSIVGRNKKSIELDLRSEAGQAAFIKLVKRADVVIENFRPGTLERWNLGFDRLSAENPGIVLTRVSGFGQTGPYAQRGGYAAQGEALGGLRHVVGFPDRPPTRVGVSMGDSLTGLFAALGTLVALRDRDSTGSGQVVDCAIYESVLAIMETLIPDYALGGHVRGRSGTVLPRIAPSNIYPTLDQDVIISANQQPLFERLCDVMERPDLLSDPRFVDHIARGQHQVAIDEIVAEWTATQTSEHLVAMLSAKGVAIGPVYTAREMLSDAHFAEREAIVELPHAQFGTIPMQNVVPKLSGSPGSVRWVGPAVGEHANEILGDLLGMSEEQINEAAGRGGADRTPPVATEDTEQGARS